MQTEAFISCMSLAALGVLFIVLGNLQTASKHSVVTKRTIHVLFREDLGNFEAEQDV